MGALAGAWWAAGEGVGWVMRESVPHLTGSCWTPPGHLPTSLSTHSFLRKGQPGVGASPG